MIVLEILFWFLILLILHTYLFFPLLIIALSGNKKFRYAYYLPDDPGLPEVSIIMSVHNEEDILDKKILSTLDTNYPSGKIKFLIGSDGSTDQSNEILNQWVKKDARISYYQYSRQGKANVINDLRNKTNSEILILTDARAIFLKSTIYELVKHFKEESIGIVGANIINRNLEKEGIAIQEWTFMSREIQLKTGEGLLWGSAIGVYGACYAVRNRLYRPVPSNFTVDDFFVSLAVLEKGYKAILENGSVVYLDVPGRSKEEFRRRVRISIGNFQNLKRFVVLLSPLKGALSFCFFSHKVIRWLVPFLLILILVLNLLIPRQREIYEWTLAFQILLVLLPLIDAFLRLFNVHSVILRFATHFYTMNLALLVGFFKFIKGVKSNVWKPTRRNQTN